MLQMYFGGDFNAEVYRGWRGERLKELLCEASLEACSDLARLGLENAWTFRSSLGRKRTIDYCLVPADFHVRSAKAINHLDLGSDHRAVQSELLLPFVQQRKPKEK